MSKFETLKKVGGMQEPVKSEFLNNQDLVELQDEGLIVISGSRVGLTEEGQRILEEQDN